jgi:hypothetical protein
MIEVLLNFGGNPPTTAATESYNGTSWTTTGSMGTARYSGAGSGTQTAGLCASGIAGGTNQTATEEFTGPGAPVTRTITTS